MSTRNKEKSLDWLRVPELLVRNFGGKRRKASFRSTVSVVALSYEVALVRLFLFEHLYFSISLSSDEYYSENNNNSNISDI